MAVRLDPFQNIVGVSWDGDGGPPQPGDPQYPVFEDGWSLATNVSGSGTLTLANPESFDDPPLPPALGDIGIAFVAAENGTAEGAITITPQEAGWNPQFHEVLGPGGVNTVTAAAWIRSFDPDTDPVNWIFNFDIAGQPRIGTILWISKNRLTNIPDAFDYTLGPFAPSQATVIAPSIAPTVPKTLLVTLLAVNTNFNLVARFPGDPLQERIFILGPSGFATDVGIGVYTELKPLAGATGPRTLSSAPESNWLAAQLAFAGLPF